MGVQAQTYIFCSLAGLKLPTEETFSATRRRRHSRPSPTQEATEALSEIDPPSQISRAANVSEPIKVFTFVDDEPERETLKQADVELGISRGCSRQALCIRRCGPEPRVRGGEDEPAAFCAWRAGQSSHHSMPLIGIRSGLLPADRAALNSGKST